MSSAVPLTVFSVVWLILLLLDRLFRRVRLKSYCRLASRLQLRVGLFNLKFFVSKSELAGVKRLLSNSSWWKFTLDVWFSTGVVVALFSALLMVRLLLAQLGGLFALSSSTPSSTLSSAEQSFFQSNSVDARTMMVPVIPGLNLPWTRLPMLVVVLLICAVAHELGHALAATGEGVPVLGFGFFLFGFYPGAFTELTGRHLDGLTTWRKLKVFSAGVWHNVVLAALGSVCSGAVLHLARRLHGPEMNAGVWVHSSPTASSSPLLFAAGTLIRSVNGCEVLNRADWSRCLLQTVSEPDQADNYYYCLPPTEPLRRLLHSTDYDRRLPPDDGPCCQPALARSHWCFYWHRHRARTTFHCLPIRIFDEQGKFDGTPVANSVCLLAVPADHDRKLFRLEARSNNSRPKTTLWIGSAAQLHAAVRVDDHVDQRGDVPRLGPLSVDDLRQFFGCVRSFSLTLALLNAVPCYGLDGQYILRALTACRAGCSPLRRLLTELAICLFTGLLLFSLLLSAFAYFMQSSTTATSDSSMVDSNPTPVFCVKTRRLDDDGRPGEKLFVNFCTSTLLPCAEMITEAELVSILESDNPGSYRVAISIGRREPVLDCGGRPGSAFTVLFNDDFHRRRTSTSDLFRTFLICVALDEIQSKHGVTLDRENWLQLKHRKHVGPIVAPYHSAVPTPSPSAKPAPVHTPDHGEYCGRLGRPLSVSLPRPWFQICKDSTDRPTKLLAKFRLTGVRRGRQVQLALSDRRIVLLVLGKYAFDEILPCAFDPDQADAQFDTDNQTLTLQLPLKADQT
ncbi:Membrane-bound transcription factor site-2 protease [Trichinella britovi]|uniref:Membrane-bound transcription factor site-2 protease n=1 Tax=Trichinella britovi TaxID=45882 RepID=A0A0V1C949_TRIBR|nr:Membrane-bound transcription factor site-2 protease [Trichinella britovi]